MEHFFTILDSMDLPEQKKRPVTLGDYGWLLRNMGIRNRSNPGYLEAINTVSQKFKELKNDR